MSLRAQIDELRERGYVIVPRFVPDGDLSTLNAVARVQLENRANPLELEADLKYPGAPRSRASIGGETVRRLLDAYERHQAFAACATAVGVRDWMEEYFGEGVWMSRAHHNCLMTKHPRYGSLTGWHRDIRYWSFEREDLVSVWFALGAETVENGALWVVPGSHRESYQADQFDEAKFFRTDRAANADVLRAAVALRLAPGDALFFHCSTLHSAGQNLTDEVKFSLVYTYHGAGNAPLAGSRSASKPELKLR